MLKDLDELACLHDRVVCTGIKPSVTTSQLHDVQLPLLQIGRIDVSDFEFSARGGPDPGGYIDDSIVIEIQSGDGVVGLGLGGLLRQRNRSPFSVKFDDAVSLRNLLPDRQKWWRPWA